MSFPKTSSAAVAAEHGPAGFAVVVVGCIEPEVVLEGAASEQTSRPNSLHLRV